jgi:hypothetical protein
MARRCVLPAACTLCCASVYECCLSVCHATGALPPTQPRQAPAMQHGMGGA